MKSSITHLIAWTLIINFILPAPAVLAQQSPDDPLRSKSNVLGEIRDYQDLWRRCLAPRPELSPQALPSAKPAANDEDLTDEDKELLAEAAAADSAKTVNSK